MYCFAINSTYKNRSKNMPVINEIIKTAVSKEQIDELKARMGILNTSEVVQEALTLLNWASKEKLKGKRIMSGNNVTGNETITTPGLTRISTNIK
jgi:hypothetical protein